MIIDGGKWDGDETDIRMSQFGGREVSTESLLEVKNNGSVVAKSLQMIYDDSILELVDGNVEVGFLKLGGEAGSATVNHHSGSFKINKLTFSENGTYYFAGAEAKLWLKGEWSIQKLLSVENSTWKFQGKKVKASQLKLTLKKVKKDTYSVISIK